MERSRRLKRAFLNVRIHPDKSSGVYKADCFSSFEHTSNKNLPLQSTLKNTKQRKMQRNAMLVSTKRKNFNRTNLVYLKLIFPFTVLQRFAFVLVLLCIVSCYSVMACDCNYHSGGCSISKPASPGNACKCSYKGFWSCAGSQTGCSDPSSHYCHNPDTSIQSCFLSGDYCEGY